MSSAKPFGQWISFVINGSFDEPSIEAVAIMGRTPQSVQ